MLVTDRRGTGRSPRSASVRISLARPSVLSHNFTAISEAGISLFKKREERREGGGREGRERMRKRKKSPEKEGRKLHFSLKGMREHFRQRHAEKRGKPISLFAALPPSFIRAREKSFQQSPAFLPSFLPPSATAAPSALVHSHHCRRWNTRK